MPITYDDLLSFAACNKLTLDGLTDLTALDTHEDVEFLVLSHWYAIDSLNLEPIRRLSRLRFLCLATDHSWDGTNRNLLVDSFQPLVSLHNLEMLHILGVYPKNGGVEPIARIPNLRKISIGNTNKYQLEDFAILSSLRPNLEGASPIDQMNFLTKCKKCNERHELYLNGTKPGAKRFACPKCNINLIRKHLQLWNVHGGVPVFHDVSKLDPDTIYQLFRNPLAR